MPEYSSFPEEWVLENPGHFLSLAARVERTECMVSSAVEAGLLMSLDSACCKKSEITEVTQSAYHSISLGVVVPPAPLKPVTTVASASTHDGCSV